METEIIPFTITPTTFFVFDLQLYFNFYFDLFNMSSFSISTNFARYSRCCYCNCKVILKKKHNCQAGKGERKAGKNSKQSTFTRPESPKVLSAPRYEKKTKNIET